MERIASAEELKNIELDLLRFFRDFCEENQLTYYLAFGTLIGAVRHKGFIPWDDDVDVLMPRKDYEKLQNLTIAYQWPDCRFLSYKSEPRYGYPWMKLASKKVELRPSRFNNGFLYGPSMDIFALDDIEGDREAALQKAGEIKKSFFLDMRKRQFFANVGKGSELNKLVRKHYYKLIGSKIGAVSRVIEAHDKKIEKICTPDAKYSLFVYDTVDSIWEKEWFGEKTVYLEFEGELFRVPENYDKVLSETYGDYMKLPPVEDRKPVHFYTAYYVD